MTFALPTICTMPVAATFLLVERLTPGRELPHAPGWYARAVLINGAQAVITFDTNRLWHGLDTPWPICTDWWQSIARTGAWSP